jgi:hypothetical protein
MSKALEDITREAAQLPREERLALAGFLLEIDETGDRLEADVAWEREIIARIQAVDQGTAVGVPHDEVMRSAKNLLR